MMYFLDTNVFLRYLVKDHTRMFQETQKLFEAIERRRCDAITCSHVYAEIVWVLQSFYAYDRDVISHIMQTIADSPIIIDDRIHMPRALNFYAEHRAKFIDCIIASHHALQSKTAILISYDKEFDAMGIARKEPQHIARL